MYHFETCPFYRKPLLGHKFYWTQGKRYFEFLFILEEKLCCLLVEHVCVELFSSSFLSPTCSICDILCYVVALLSITEKEPEYIGQDMH